MIGPPSRPTRPLSGPDWEMPTEALVRSPSAGSSRCHAVVVTPGIRETQVNDDPASNSVTVQVDGGSFGCLTRTLLPGPIGPAPAGSTVDIEAVHCGHLRTSASTAQTVSRPAAMSVEDSKRMPNGTYRVPCRRSKLSCHAKSWT